MKKIARQDENAHLTDSIEMSRRQVAAVAREVFRRRLTTSCLGAVSLRLPITDRFLVTPGEISMEDVRPEDVCLVDSGGNLLGSPAGLTPPAETSLYINVFKDRSDVDAIIHFFPPYGSAYASKGQLFPLLSRKARREIGEILKVDCRECPARFKGLCSCRTDIRESYAGVGTLLLKEDGMATLAASLDEALYKADLVEKAAEAAFMAGRLGFSGEME